VTTPSLILMSTGESGATFVRTGTSRARRMRVDVGTVDHFSGESGVAQRTSRSTRTKVARDLSEPQARPGEWLPPLLGAPIKSEP
jgi:hypothetical protein